jgi:RNA polymerase sigma-70 factor (sigma-E family)
VNEQDDRDFEEFVAASGRRLLLRAVLLVGGDRGAGEDLLQSAFERTYRLWPKIATGQPEAYVRRALVNGATSRWRRLRARVTEVPLLTDGAGGGPGPLLADHAEALSLRDGLVRALLALPPKQRAVIVLRYLDDLPDTEIAAALGCSEGSVRSHASRGLTRLRDSKHLAAEAAGGEPPAPLLAAVPMPPRPAAPDILSNEPAPAARQGSPATPAITAVYPAMGGTLPARHRPRAAATTLSPRTHPKGSTL